MISSARLQVKLVDGGFDFEVTFQTGDIEDASFKFEVGRFLVEVKATRTGEARLTPLQAEIAVTERDRYVCPGETSRGLLKTSQQIRTEAVSSRHRSCR